MFKHKAILIIHGYAGGTYDQEELANYLELDPHFDVFRFTLPGHTMNLSKVKYNEWIDKSEEYLNRLISNGYHTIYLIGHSMGGVIASYLATKYYQVKKLVLAAPAFQFLSIDGNIVDIKGSIKDATSLLKTYGGNEVFSRFLKLDVSTIKEFVTLVKEYHDYPKEITCPVLLLHGTSDHLVPKESSEYVYNSVKSNNKTIYIIKGVTHDVFSNDRYQEIFSITKNFLKNRTIPGRFDI